MIKSEPRKMNGELSTCSSHCKHHVAYFFVCERCLVLTQETAFCFRMLGFVSAEMLLCSLYYINVFVKYRNHRELSSNWLI